jgi:hypothetical protein
MHINKVLTPSAFTPIKLEVIISTEQELKALQNVFFYDSTIPKLIKNSGCTNLISSIDLEVFSEFMTQMSGNLHNV